MTILAFYPVGNESDWGRDEFDAVTDEEAFRAMWAHRVEMDVRFYDMESHYGNHDTYDIGCYHIGEADDFETDYNNEELDGGWWCKCLHVPSDIVKQIIMED